MKNCPVISTNTGMSTYIDSKVFAEEPTSAAYNGYMSGKDYPVDHDSSGSSINYYGTGFSYSNGTYTLTNAEKNNPDLSYYHYTCHTSSKSCTTLHYVFYSYGSIQRYITLTNGESINDALAAMKENRDDSRIKKIIESWFETTLIPYFTNNNKIYTDYLVDSIWCSDRNYNNDNTKYGFTQSGWNLNGGSTSNYLYYSGYGRRLAGTPTLTCSNKSDSFTVEETTKGNGLSQYPVGLLTMDEVMLAGGQGVDNKNYYLYTGETFWTMTPAYFDHYQFNFGYGPNNYYVNKNGKLYTAQVCNTSQGVRPVITIKKDTKVDDGNGTSSSPYKFVLE